MNQDEFNNGGLPPEPPEGNQEPQPDWMQENGPHPDYTPQGQPPINPQPMAPPPYAQGPGPGMPPPPGYPGGMYQEVKTPGMIIAGFVLSLVGLFCMGFLGIVGLILSAMGLKNFDPETQKGKGLAIAGVVLGVIDTIFFIILLIVNIAAAVNGYY